MSTRFFILVVNDCFHIMIFKRFQSDTYWFSLEGNTILLDLQPLNQSQRTSYLDDTGHVPQEMAGGIVLSFIAPRKGSLSLSIWKITRSASRATAILAADFPCRLSTLSYSAAKRTEPRAIWGATSTRADLIHRDPSLVIRP